MATTDTDLDALAGRLRGTLIRPGSDEYEEARQVHNRRFDRRPRAIARAADSADVVAVVEFARTSGLPLAIRSGGHSAAGHSVVDDGIVLDLSGLRNLAIDADARTAWAGPGLTAGEYTAAAAAHGLATPFGDTGSVGLGGLVPGGGVGWLARKHGLTIDNLLAAEVVTADGRVLVASEAEHADLFWAIRGGGGNFGVVTAFHFRLHPVGMVFGGPMFLPPDPGVITRVVEAAAAAPDELTMIAAVMRIPPMPMIPAAAHGQVAFMVAVVYAGDPAAGEAAVAPIRAIAPAMVDMIGPMPYPAIFELTKEAAQPGPWAMRAATLAKMTPELAATLVGAIGRAPSPAAFAQLRVLGGAMARVPAGATAFAQRDDPILLSFIDVFVGPAPAEAHLAWTESAWAEVRPHGIGVYPNFLEDEGEGRVREAYPDGVYERLAALKRTWDPGNLFHLNQNIRPA